MALSPPLFLRGNNDAGAKGVFLWQEFGPWAPRRLAALHYAKTYGSLPPGRDRAAASLTTNIPDPLMRAPLRKKGLNLLFPQSKPDPPPSFVDMTTGLINLCGETQTQVPPVMAMPARDSSRMPKGKGALPP